MLNYWVKNGPTVIYTFIITPINLPQFYWSRTGVYKTVYREDSIPLKSLNIFAVSDCFGIKKFFYSINNLAK